MIKSIVFGCLLFSAFWCTAYPLNAAQLQALEYSSLGIHLKFQDETWQLVEQQELNENTKHSLTPVTLGILQRKSVDEDYRARLSIVLDSLTNIKNTLDPLNGYFRQAADFLRDKQNFRISKQGKISIPSLSPVVYEIVATHRHFGLGYRQLILQKGEKVILLTFTAKMNAFNERNKEFEQFLHF